MKSEDIPGKKTGVCRTMTRGQKDLHRTETSKETLLEKMVSAERDTLTQNPALRGQNTRTHTHKTREVQARLFSVEESLVVGQGRKELSSASDNQLREDDVTRNQ